MYVTPNSQDGKAESDATREGTSDTFINAAVYASTALSKRFVHVQPHHPSSEIRGRSIRISRISIFVTSFVHSSAYAVSLCQLSTLRSSQLE